MILAWAALSAGMKIIWGVTLVASAIFLIQSIATFIGAGGSDIDTDINFDGLDSDVPDAIAGGTDMNLYTFRNLVNFCLGFGWSFIILQGKIASTAVLVIVSVSGEECHLHSVDLSDEDLIRWLSVRCVREDLLDEFETVLIEDSCSADDSDSWHEMRIGMKI